MRNLPVILLFLVMTVTANAQTSESNYAKILEKAELSLVEKNTDLAQYYITRYAALVLEDKPVGESLDKLVPLIQRLGLKSTSFISGKYSPDFLEWFIIGTYYMWGVPENATSNHEGSSVLTFNEDAEIYVGVKAFPFIEQWSIIGGKQKSVSSTYLHLASAKKKPVLIVGSKNSSQISPVEVQMSSECDGYQHFWRPEIVDIDSDGNPEILIRYNMTHMNGFTQKLDVFRLHNQQLELVDSLIGPLEGIARWVGGSRFQQGKSKPSNTSLGHLSFDQTEIKSYEFKSGKFVQTGVTKTVPNILLNEAFAEHYDLKK
jgi:hypothetical protein